MGCIESCLQGRDGARDPILDAEARARAAEAAQQRQDRFNNSSAGKAAAKAAARDKAHTSSAAHDQRIHDILN